MSAVCKRLPGILAFAACILLLFGGCGKEQGSYRYTYLDVFDTVTGITVYAPSQAEADRRREAEKDADEKERRLQQATLRLQSKYGKNAVLKGMNLEQGATTILRNRQIGGHRSGEE